MIAALVIIAMSFQEESALLERALTAESNAERARALSTLAAQGSERSLKALVEHLPTDPSDPRWPPLLRYTARVGGDDERAAVCAGSTALDPNVTWAPLLALALGKGAFTPCIEARLTTLIGASADATVMAALDATLAHPKATLAIDALTRLVVEEHETLVKFRAVSLLARHKRGPLATQRAVLAHATRYADENPSEGMPEEHWLALKALSGKKLARRIAAWKDALQ